MIKHGQARNGRRTSEHRAWTALFQRCYNPKCKVYFRYGGRGIQVCERWKDFQNFYADMGPKPSREYSIDRIDNEGHYQPGNCRWATILQQANNKRPKPKPTGIARRREFKSFPRTVRRELLLGPVGGKTKWIYVSRIRQRYMRFLYHKGFPLHKIAAMLNRHTTTVWAGIRMVGK